MNSRSALLLPVACLLSLAAHAQSGSTLIKPRPPVSGPTPASARIENSYGKLPMSFELNAGQTAPQVKFLSRGSGYSVYLTPSEAVLSLTRNHATRKPLARHDNPGGRDTNSAAPDVIRMRLKGARQDVQVTGQEKLTGTANYFIGSDPKQWHSEVPTFGKVRYAGVYPGIDLIYYGSQGKLEYDFVIAPGANPKPVELHFSGARKLQLSPNGGLDVVASNGEITFRKPDVYQIKDGQRQQVDGRFTLHAKNDVRFALGSYDHSRELVIDPVLDYSTFLGGSGYDYGYAVAVDATGDAYVTGETSSTDFPVSSGAYQTTDPSTVNGGHAFIAKMNPAGSALLYATYLGGTNFDVGDGIALDASGDAYVTGVTYSIDFPVTSGAFQATNKSASSGQDNAFVTKLNPSGTGLVYSTYLGGTAGTNLPGDYGQSIAVNSSGEAYVTGAATTTNFPTTSGAFQLINKAAGNSAGNAFVTKLNAAGSGLVYSTYLGGSGVSSKVADFAFSISVDTAGNAYLTGLTYSPDFPVSTGAFQASNRASSGNPSAFVTKINPAGSTLVYSTYLGGSVSTDGYGIAVDSSGYAYVAGDTDSTDFPVTSGAFQTSNPEASIVGLSAFIAKLNPLGTALTYATYLGGSGGRDSTYGVAVDASGHAYVTGDTNSSDFPITAGAFQPVNYGASQDDDNAYVTELNPAGTGLMYSTFLGGASEGDTYGNGIAVDTAGNAYVTGSADTSDFPVTSGAFQTVFKSTQNNSGFVAKFSLALSSTLTSTGTAVTSNGDPLKVGANVIFKAYVTPITGSGVPTGSISFSVAGGAPTTVNLDGTGHASFSISSLSDGTHTIIATYSGDSKYAASSGSLSETIVGPPVLIYPSGADQSAQVGSVFAYPFYAYVYDSAGDAVAGAVVDFTATGVQLSASSATTDSTGAAYVTGVATSTGTLPVTETVLGTSVQTSFNVTGTGPVSLQFVPVTPCRLVDTRNATGEFGGPELTSGDTRTFYIPDQNACNIPSAAVAYSLNVTVVPHGFLNYLTMWPAGETQPTVSTLNSDGRIKANAAITPAGVDGGVSIFASDPTQVILDIDGYFVPAGTDSALEFFPLTPCRIADTRNATGPLGGPSLAGGTSRAFPVVSSSCSIPPSAQAYSLNITAVPRNGSLNYLTTWPTGETQPNVSTLNASTGAVTANAAAVPAGTSGDVSIFVSDTSDVILDVNGYFAPPASGGLSLYTVTPCRVIDTRGGQGAFSGTLSVDVETSSCAPPSTAQAYVLNATVVPDSDLNYLSLWPATETQPGVSTLNALDGAITSNMAIVPTLNGSIDAYASSATNLIFDISSYFAP